MAASSHPTAGYPNLSGPLGGRDAQPVCCGAHVTNTAGTTWLHRLRERGVIRVAASYAVIAWLLLQIADVTFEPLGVPKWVMVSLIVTAAAAR